MQIRHYALLAAATLCSWTAAAYTGTCLGSERGIEISINTDDRGQITELQLKAPGTSPTRYPEATATRVILPSFSLAFTAKATANHEAMELHIAGRPGRLRLGNESIDLVCDWM